MPCYEEYATAIVDEARTIISDLEGTGGIPASKRRYVAFDLATKKVLTSLTETQKTELITFGRTEDIITDEGHLPNIDCTAYAVLSACHKRRPRIAI